MQNKSEEKFMEQMMHEYRVVIRSLLDAQSTDFVENASLSHAAVILEEMVRDAKTSFFAVADSLNPIAWNSDVVQSLSEAKRRGVDIELLVTTPDDASLSHLNGWDESVRSCIRRISDKVRRSGVELANFAIMDRRAFRFEMDKDRASAVFCANNKTFAAKLVDSFRFLKSDALSLAPVV